MKTKQFQRSTLQKNKQGGIALLEGLIAILIFSIGVLGMVGLQARSVQGLGEAAFRAQAVEHASELLAEMWTVDIGRRATLYNGTNGAGGARYLTWRNQVISGSRSLPSAGSNLIQVQVVTNTAPISITPGSNIYFSDVTITISWLPPGADAAAVPNQYVTTARIWEPQS